jgi:hypothetical protein
MNRGNTAIGYVSPDDSNRQKQNIPGAKSEKDAELIDIVAEQLARLLFDYVQQKRVAALKKLRRGSA